MSVEKKIKEIIMNQLDLDEKEITPEAAFIDDLGADSLDIVEMVMAMEEAFDLEIPDEDVENITIVQDVIDYIKQRTV
jgi:acyl carrier protein